MDVSGDCWEGSRGGRLKSSLPKPGSAGLNISSSKVSCESYNTSRGSSQIRESYSNVNSKVNESGIYDDKSPKFVIDDNSVNKIKKTGNRKMSINSRHSSRNIYGSCNYRQRESSKRESSKKSDFKYLSKGN